MNLISVSKNNYNLIKDSLMKAKEINKLQEDTHIEIFISIYFKDGSYARTLGDSYSYYNIIQKYNYDKNPSYDLNNEESINTIVDTSCRIIVDTIDYKMNNVLNPESNPLISLYIYGEDNNLNRRIFNINDISTAKGTLKVTTYKNGKKDIYSTNNI